MQDKYSMTLAYGESTNNMLEANFWNTEQQAITMYITLIFKGRVIG